MIDIWIFAISLIIIISLLSTQLYLIICWILKFTKLYLSIPCRKPAPKSLFEVSMTSRRIVWPIDSDTFWHMSNCRYLLQQDFVRIDFWASLGIVNALFYRNATMNITAQSIRFRLPIHLFHSYKIHTQLIGWDDTGFITEQKFVNGSNITTTVCFAKTTVIGTTPHDLLKDIGITDEDIISPVFREDIKLWYDSVCCNQKLQKRSEGR